jgi:hypothetical protein
MPAEKPEEKNSGSNGAPASTAERIDERLDHLEALAETLSAEIELLRAERAQSQDKAGKDRRGEPDTEALRADAKGERTDAGLARVAALQLVDEGLDRDAVTAELQRLGMDDPEPVVREVFQDHPATKAG